jgi:N-acetylmuramoyl-L-alanine amidase
MVVFAAFVALFTVPKQLVVCIDPGHPSEVGRGARGKSATEVQVAWNIAKLLERRLEHRGYKVVMTKHSEEQLVRNRERARIANDAHADLMLRLHCDASRSSGFATYYPDRQGVSEGVTGPDPRVLAATAPIAKRFHAALAKSLEGALPDQGLKTDMDTAIGSKQGALTGSVFSQVPVVLVEMCVLTNPVDEKFISSRRGSRRMADALADAVDAALRD